MRCKEACQQLQLYLDNRLTIQQIRTLEAHLASCNACLEELTIFETVVNDLETFKVVVERDDLNAKIMSRLAIAASQRNNSLSHSLVKMTSPKIIQLTPQQLGR